MVVLAGGRVLGRRVLVPTVLLMRMVPEVLARGMVMRGRHGRSRVQPRAGLSEREADHGQRHQQSREPVHEALHVLHEPTGA